MHRLMVLMLLRCWPFLYSGSTGSSRRNAVRLRQRNAGHQGREVDWSPHWGRFEVNTVRVLYRCFRIS